MFSLLAEGILIASPMSSRHRSRIKPRGYSQQAGNYDLFLWGSSSLHLLF
ncbi:hypothetical protein SAM23877_1083 [Streptomyces ambofaciens ATCC 23877]|uniref:Uncharacterized protein n=1 Tax=Streptomyces ambofaciens (strain ATCC 23877 / 3486 / DSM 40053 / JCM 4204 / NBRC 12836 / NRRL B-2516) TaxID=278992 RepID=A0A0K2AMR7_STRA7|nr:hypothetical protein SAM23877_1083 [Streptomyces ambofaciens ATCC 23877]